MFIPEYVYKTGIKKVPPFQKGNMFIGVVTFDEHPSNSNPEKS